MKKTRIKKRDRSEAFKRLEVLRVDKLKMAFIGLRKLSNKKNYSYDREDLDNIIKEAYNEIRQLKKVYDLATNYKDPISGEMIKTIPYTPLPTKTLRSSTPNFRPGQTDEQKRVQKQWIKNEDSKNG